MHIRLGIIQ